jgi:hypothetical protein
VTTDSKKGTAMTVRSSIDPGRLIEEQLAQASPDLLRDLLQTFINVLLSAEADAVWCRVRHRVGGSAQPAQWLPSP